MKKPKQKFNQLPIQVSQGDFNRYIKPFLSRGKRGPKPKVSFFKTFNYILYVLHTGCQWERLPIRQKETSWQAVYNHHNTWSKDGSYENLFVNSVEVLRDTGQLDLSILHGDGSNTVAKKGVSRLAIQGINIKKEKKS